MLFKFTMLMQHVSNVSQLASASTRVGGFSESWYFQGTSAQELYAAAGLTAGGAPGGVPDLMTARAGFLPAGSTIVGARVQQLDPLGPSQSFAKTLPGAVAVTADIPQMALLCTVPGLAVKNIRRAMFRAIPDGDVSEGEWTPRTSTLNAVKRFFTALAPWRFRGLDLAAATIPIVNILSDGTVTLGGASASFAVNDRVKIMRTENASGDGISGIFTVVAIPGPTSIKVATWTAGPTTGGVVRKHAFIFPLVDVANTTIGRIVTKRVGRAFLAYRGRRSNRS